MKTHYIIYCIIIAIGLAFAMACSDSDEAPEPQEFTQGNVTFTFTSEPAPADNAIFMPITVTLSENAVPGQPVVFQTPQGEFGNGKTKDTVNLAADRTATVYLKSSNPGSFFVSASYLGAEASELVTFIAPFTGIDLAFDKESAMASGSDEIQVTVEALSGSTQSSSGSIELTTTLGRFSDGSQNITLTPVSGSRTVSTKLRSSDPGQATVSATGNGFSVSREVTFTNAVDFELSLSAPEIDADGESVAAIRFKLLRGSLASDEEVTFKTNAGSFTYGGMTTTASIITDSTAFAYLNNTADETAIVTVTYNGTTRQIPVAFIPAVPSDIQVTLQSGSVINEEGKVIDISAAFQRQKGEVTPNQIVTWADSTTTGTSPGIFLNATRIKDDGSSTVEYHLQDEAFTGEIYFIATVGGVSGKSRVVVKANTDAGG